MSVHKIGLFILILVCISLYWQIVEIIVDGYITERKVDAIISYTWAATLVGALDRWEM